MIFLGSSVSSNQQRGASHQHRHHNPNHHQSPRQLVDIRTIEVRLIRECGSNNSSSSSSSNDGYGFTLRPTTSAPTTHPSADNSSSPNSSNSKSLSHRSFVVTLIRPSSSAERLITKFLLVFSFLFLLLSSHLFFAHFYMSLLIYFPTFSVRLKCQSKLINGLLLLSGMARFKWVIAWYPSTAGTWLAPV